VAVKHVEIDEIREDQASRPLLQSLLQFRHAVGVVFRRDIVVDATAVIDVVNLPHAENGRLLLGEYVEQHWPRRFDGVVVAPLGAPEIAWRAGERPRDHAAHTVRPVKNFACDFAHSIELRDGDHIFMRRNLENTVTGRIHDREAGGDVP
jgi:hypothetical protein